ncbi:type II toxin-antitoxin system RelE/ParE family toxin [Pararhizobium sp. BT-229]|uniref:type II toxin-antitoxin system RelE/ParE family toxin n=1 Tax=Pararhizobium sp. BT-229 TaxID=2986923 RepID=UPI0035572E4A
MITSRNYRYSRRAIRDLAQIYNFIAKSDTIAADRLIEGIRRKVASIAHTGFTGVPRDDFAPGLRAFIHKNHCIYFQVTDSHLLIVRVLHGRQDLSSEDFPESEI